MAQGDYGTPSNRVNITSERWRYTPHTSDPAGTEKGDEWLRVDMDTGDKIATLRFQYNDSGDVYDMPVLPVGSSDSTVEEKFAFGTPNGMGYVPGVDVGQYSGAFPKRKYADNDVIYELHDDKITDGSTELYFEDNHVERPWQVTGDPTAMYVPSRDETYICWHAKTEAWVTRYDHSTGTWHDNEFVGEGGVDDYHGAPSMFVDSDGYIHVAWGAHAGSGTMHYGRSDSTYDITSWTVSTSEPFATDTTYSMFFESGDESTLYYAARYGTATGSGSTRPFRYWTSTDNGSNWSTGTDLIEFSGYWMYNPTYLADGSDIHLFLREYDYGNTDSEKYYHAIFDTSDETLRAMDGTSLSIPLGRSEAINNCEIADVSDLPNVAFFDSRIRARFDGNKNPYAVCHGYSGSGGNPDTYYNMFVYYDGSSWSTIEEVTDVAGFHAMPALRVNSATDVDMFTNIEETGVEKIVRFNWNGSSWSQENTILAEQYEHYGASMNVYTPDSEMQVLFSEYDGSGSGTNDRTTRLKGFAYGENGIVTRVWPTIADSAIAQYDAQALSGSDGATISTWPDEIGSFDLTGSDPTIRDSGINGNRSLQFNGDSLTNSTFSLSPPLTIIAVVELVGTTDQILFDSNAASGADDDHYFRWDGSNWTYKFAESVSEIQGSTDSTVQLLSGVSASSDIVFREGGTQTASSTDGPIHAFNELIAGNYSGGGLPADAYVGELIFYDDDLRETGELSSEESRLADKWGITL